VVRTSSPCCRHNTWQFILQCWWHSSSTGQTRAAARNSSGMQVRSLLARQPACRDARTCAPSAASAAMMLQLCRNQHMLGEQAAQRTCGSAGGHASCRASAHLHRCCCCCSCGQAARAHLAERRTSGGIYIHHTPTSTSSMVRIACVRMRTPTGARAMGLRHGARPRGRRRARLVARARAGAPHTGSRAAVGARAQEVLALLSGGALSVFVSVRAACVLRGRCVANGVHGGRGEDGRYSGKILLRRREG
jgi:hypothetical protein